MKLTVACIIILGCFSLSETLYGQNVEVSVLEVQLVPLDDILEAALIHSPYLKYDSAMIEAKEKELLLEKRKWHNYLSLFANYSNGNQGFLTNGAGTDAQNNVFSGYRYGLNFGLPISTFTNRKIYIKKSKAELNAYQFKKDQTEMELRQRIIAEYNHLITAQRVFKIKSSAKENALVVQQMADKQFREGVTSLEAYANVSSITVNAEADYEHVKNNFNSLYMQFEELIGVSLTTLMEKK